MADQNSFDIYLQTLPSISRVEYIQNWVKATKGALFYDFIHSEYNLNVIFPVHCPSCGLLCISSNALLQSCPRHLVPLKGPITSDIFTDGLVASTTRMFQRFTSLEILNL